MAHCLIGRCSMSFGHEASVLEMATDAGTGNARISRVAQHEFLDMLTCGLVRIDGDWRLEYANAAARVVLAAEDGMALVQGRIEVRPPYQQRRATAWLAEMAPCAPLAVARASGRPAYLIDRLDTTARARAGEVQHRLVIVDTSRPIVVSVEGLTAVFGLTTMEARLAATLAGGATLHEFAHSQRVAVSTARSHLESVFAKTGTRRQAQLVAAALRCAAPMQFPAAAPIHEV